MTEEEKKELEEKPEEKQDLEQKEKKQLGPVPYERFAEINERATKAEAKLKEIEDKKKQDADQKLADEKKWEDLAKQRELDLKAKDAELARLRVAAKKGLPVDLIDRLKGETEADIEADADKLLEFIKVDDSKGVPPHKRGGVNTKLDISTMTPKEIREHANEIISQGNQK